VRLNGCDSTDEERCSASVGSRLNERRHPTPEQILNLKICDPAMGSGAFLVETCRQLGDELIKAWHVHKCVPKLPLDEDELLHARRLIAQRCLYGVDKNPMAVEAIGQPCQTSWRCRLTSLASDAVDWKATSVSAYSPYHVHPAAFRRQLFAHNARTMLALIAT
jgi:hypothetical protein